MNLRINIRQNVDSVLIPLIDALKGPGRADLHRAVGLRVQELTADHIRTLAQSRHATAEKLGAAPTNHFAQAADKVAGSAALASGADGATLTINHPGFTRAFRSVRIAPKTARSLAIPVHALSYGTRAAELWDRLALFVKKDKYGKSSRIIAAKIGGAVTPLYILCKSVTQKQDRTLLPTDEQFRAAAKAGAEKYLAQMRADKAGNQ